MLRLPHSPAPASRLVTQLAVGGMALAFTVLGTLGLWAMIVTRDHTDSLSRAGVQTSGHMRAAQALGQIDTHTDLLEDGIDAQIVARLRTAQRVLGESLQRMQRRSVVARQRRLAQNAEPQVEALRPTVEAFLAAVRAGDPDAQVEAEERMEEILDGLQLRFNDVGWDPSRLLSEQAAAASASQRTILRTELVIIPLGLAFVALGAWQLRAYRRRSEAAMRAALETSARDARTDALTGLANRRALVEELDRRTETVLVLADLNGFKHYNDSFGHAAGDALLRRLADKLKAACDGHALPVRLGGDEFCVLFEPGTPADDARALMQDALVEEGEGFRITSACGAVRIPEDAADAGAALRLADTRMYAAKAGSRATLERQMCDLLLRMLEARHPGLGEHVAEVTELAGECAELLGLGPDELQDIRRAAQMHDIGKVAMPESIIAKSGPLTAEEWAFIRTHTLVGERVLAGVPAMDSVAAIVRSSHERWDGTGYPDRLAGDGISIGARVIAVADAFSAMTEPRAYRTPRTIEDALAELRRCAGSQFDPSVVDAFIAAYSAKAATHAVA